MMGDEEPTITPENAPAIGRYLMREQSLTDSEPFEAKVLEWSAGGRVKISLHGGTIMWREPKEDGAPLLVEKLPTRLVQMEQP